MAELTEKPEWSGVKQLTRLDKVEGGRQGAANLQAQQLVQRTAWLKEALESFSDYRQYTFS
ncbi:SGNH/GDSL hydrolase family protein, partial [Klebsiella pneumoniae]|nr:SGNH/GDSL hydrolase family protein [Klebsiella pneumoniae]